MAARSQFFVTVFAEKQIQRAAPKNCYCHPPVRILYITCSYGLGRKPISMLCIRFASSHCLHLPNLPTPPTSYAAASHSLLVPRIFMPFTAPTAANISSCLVISAAKTYRTFRLDKYTSRRVFCLQVSSTSDEQQSENPTHLLCCCKPCLSSFIRSFPFHFVAFSLAGSVVIPWPPPPSATTSLLPRLKQSLLRRLSFYFAPLVETAQSNGFTSQPSFHFISLQYASSFLIPRLSQPHSSIPVWQPGYCHCTFFRLAGRFLSHIPCYSDRQARKPHTT